MQTLFVFPDGREVASGPGAAPAIRSVTVTAQANPEPQLLYGSACAVCLEAELIDPGGSFTLEAGTEFACWRLSGGSRTLLGRFTAETPSRPGPNSLKFTAYDRMLLADTDLTQWLKDLDGWPYTIRDLLLLTCRACGLTWEETDLPCGDYPVARFYRQVTGRQLIGWAAGANGCFAHITAEGKLRLSPFTAGGSIDTAHCRSAEVAHYATAPIARITVRQTESDVGVSWPADGSGETYCITGNPLLATQSAEALSPYLQKLAQGLLGLSYTPARLEVFDTDAVPGQLLTLHLPDGTQATTAVFCAVYREHITVLSSTGARSRDSATALASRDQTQLLQGRMTQLTLDLEGVSARVSQESAALEGLTQQVSSNWAEFTVRSEAISGLVADAEAAQQESRSLSTQLEQTARSLELSIADTRTALDTKADAQVVEELTEHFLFSRDGLTISNSATGMGIGVSEERVVFTGGSADATAITPTALQTARAQVAQRLDIGGFALLRRTNGSLSLRCTGG